MSMSKEAKITLRNAINSIEKRYKALDKNFKEYDRQFHDRVLNVQLFFGHSGQNDNIIL